MRTSRPLLALAALALAAAPLVAAPTSAQAAVTVKVTPLHFKVNIGPTGSEVCDIVGDLYTPSTATSAHRVPALLTTNGFGGSKDDQAGIGQRFASRGYAVLSYSGLGFGGSGCKITLDDPDWDGKAASQLVSYLGGKSGIAFTDAKHTIPAPVLNVVQRDAKDHSGHAAANDPRVGMVGGSYGGQVQFAAAAVDKRIDTIVPVITWSDLSYSLSPNNTSQTTGVQTSTPGAAKLVLGPRFLGDRDRRRRDQRRRRSRASHRLPQLRVLRLPGPARRRHDRHGRPVHDRLAAARLGQQLRQEGDDPDAAWSRARTTPCSTSTRASPTTAPSRPRAPRPR